MAKCTVQMPSSTSSKATGSPASASRQTAARRPGDVAILIDARTSVWPGYSSGGSRARQRSRRRLVELAGGWSGPALRAGRSSLYSRRSGGSAVVARAQSRAGGRAVSAFSTDEIAHASRFARDGPARSAPARCPAESTTPTSATSRRARARQTGGPLSLRIRSGKPYSAKARSKRRRVAAMGAPINASHRSTNRLKPSRSVNG